MKIRLAGLENDSIVDGPGYRLSVFTQGCPHHCEGCHNPESHDFNGGRDYDTDEIIAKMAGNPLLSGVTLSGGEPMCQSAACAVIAEAAHKAGLNVWCYTGYTWEQLWKEADPERLKLIRAADVLVDGPFILAERSLELTFCGSRNQRLIDVPKSLEAGKPVIWKKPEW